MFIYWICSYRLLGAITGAWFAAGPHFLKADAAVFHVGAAGLNKAIAIVEEDIQ
jgi:hypothetical protein